MKHEILHLIKDNEKRCEKNMFPKFVFIKSYFIFCLSTILFNIK